MITHCSKCGYEIDESRRMADNDEPTTEFNEENGLPEDHVEGRDEETMECMCMEVDHFHDGNPNDCEKCRMTPFNKWIENRGVKN